jgi:type VI secretion system protein ImpA
MNHDQYAILFAKADSHFTGHLGTSLATLLAPIAGSKPTGVCAKSNGLHAALRDARREDDTTIPQGDWIHPHKHADWHAISMLIADNFCHTTKDLQLAAWLLEAQIHQHGFSGIASSIVLMTELLSRYGKELHPQEINDSTAQRANIMRWINRKLLPTVKRVPLTATDQEKQYTWADRELAERHQHLKPGANEDLKSVTVSEIQKAMSLTPVAHHQSQHCAIAQAIEALTYLTHAINRYFSDDCPSVSGMGGLLKQIQSTIASELYKRGVPIQPDEAPHEVHEETHEAPKIPPSGIGGDALAHYGNIDAHDLSVAPDLIADREQAYAMLEMVAQALMISDPHSPAPYLVQRAVQWGRLSTSELYRQVFIEMGGQLNIFELLGLRTPEQQG